MRPDTYHANIPERTLPYHPELKKRWSQMWREWLASGRKDRSVWEEFQPLLGIPGFRFEAFNGGRFAEALVALDLHQRGYLCTHAVV